MKKISVIILVMLTAAPLFSQQTKSAEDAKGLEVGVQAPDFNAIDASGNTFNLDAALKDGPVVMIFYRGFWCPHCNKHLGVIQDSLDLIMEKGATVVAVSPQNPEYLEQTADKTGASFKLLFDENSLIAAAYDVSFYSPKKKLMVYNRPLNADPEKSESEEAMQLPIPATYIVDQNGKIVWRHLDPNYKSRSSVKMIIENLSR